MTDNGRRLLDHAKRLGSHQTTRLFLATASKSLGVVLLGFAVLALLDHFFSLPALVRAAGFAAGLSVLLAWGGRTLFQRLPALKNAEEAARRTEGESEELKDQLVPAMQILRHRGERKTGYSSDLVDAFVTDTVEKVKSVNPGALPYNESAKRGALWALGGAVAVVLGFVIAGPASYSSSLARLPLAFAEIGPRVPSTFFVDPGEVSVPRGQDVELAVRIENARIEDDEVRAKVQWRETEDDPWRERELVTQAFPLPRFETTFENVRESFRYRFEHGGDFSEEFGVQAVPHPSLTLEEVRYDYPDYTGLPDRTVSDGSGDLSAVKGTRATLVARSTNEPREAFLVLDSGAEYELEIDDTGRLSVSIPIENEDAYHLEVEDQLGLRNQNPLHYRIRALTDEAPFVRLLEPGGDVDLDESLRVDLRYSAVDDFGLGAVELVYEVSRREGTIERTTIDAANQQRTETSGVYEWSLVDMSLLPGDTVTYRLEVLDNNGIEGPSLARTREYILRFPTLSEIYAEIDEGQEASIDDLEDVLEEARKVEEQVEEISREILKQGESTWENRKEVERTLETQQQLSEELQRVQDEIQSSMDQLAESEFMTLEALQKMEAIEKLMDEVATEEMKKALEKLQQAMEQTNPRLMQEDLAEFQEQQEDLMKALDRVMENLKQFRLEEAMKAAVRELEELAARQEQVNDELREARKRSEERGTDEEESGESDNGEGEDGEGDDSEMAESTDEDGGQNGEGENEQLAEADTSDSEGNSDESDSSDSSEGGDDSESSEGESGEASEQELAEADTSESSSGENREGEQSESQSGQNQEGEPQDSQQGSEQGEQSSEPSDPTEDLERLAQEEKTLAEEARRLEKELEKLADMAEELRDAQDSQSMQQMSEQMSSEQIPGTMDDMAQQMEGGNPQEAQEQGEKALTQLQRMLDGMMSLQNSMNMKALAISQAAINRAVRDLLSVSADEEALTSALRTIPRNSSSSTRAFADEQYLLLEGTERVEEMLSEVAKDTPLMDSVVGKRLEEGIDAMEDAAFDLENGAVHLAQDDGSEAVRDVNAVVIKLLETVQAMSSCASGMPMSGMMQQLQELSGDQQKLNQMMQEMMKNGGGSLERRLQSQMQQLADEQRRIQEELEGLLEEMGSGRSLLGRLDDVSEKLDDVAKKLQEGALTEEMLKEQNWAVTRLLDAQRSIRDRDFGRQRRSETAEELADLLPPGALPEGLEEGQRDLREDLLKALERRYPPKYEELIRRYFRSLTQDAPSTDLP